MTSFMHAAVWKKGDGIKAHATIPKDNLGYHDQYTVAVEPTFVAFVYTSKQTSMASSAIFSAECTVVMVVWTLVR